MATDDNYRIALVVVDTVAGGQDVDLSQGKSSDFSLKSVYLALCLQTRF